MLQEQLREPLEHFLGSPDACLNRARGIHDAYTRLDRSRAGADEVLELKLATLYWRRELLRRLLEHPPAWLSTDDNTLAGIIDALHTRLPDSLVAALGHYVSRDTLDYLLARQGMPPRESPIYRSLAGPGIALDIRANRRSRWPFERWKRTREFRLYELRGDGVDFRGMHLRPGDVMLAHVNRDGNGVYTALCEPTRFSSHAAVFAILEDAEGRYPAAIETYEKGVRAVPLNVFLGEGFSAYVEVYRHKDLDDSHPPLINKAAFDMLGYALGYNFDSRSNDRSYISCCTVGSHLHADAGLEPASPKSGIRDPRIQENARKFEFTFFDFFSPVDYLLDDNFRCIGWVDNHQFEDLLARELVEGRFKELFAEGTVNPKRLPLKGKINLWGIRQIRRRSLAGRILGAVEGFDDRTLPNGPDVLMAMIIVIEEQLAKVIKRTRQWLRDYDDWPEYFSFDEFSRRPEVRAQLNADLKLPWLE